MALTFYNIRKWTRMVAGKSEMHVHQTIGEQFIPGEIAGYFNNMMEKVMKEPELVENDSLPMNHAEQGDVVFPVTIFQYALGLYDLYLLKKDQKYIRKFLDLANWALDNQEAKGAWNNFGFIYPNAPYGAMCQSEGASVLIRAFVHTKDSKYLDAAKNAISFMLLPIEAGGTSQSVDNDICFFEFTNKPIVLNGWIFSIMGIYDLAVIDKESYGELWTRSVNSLIKSLYKFDNHFWSMYDLGGRIASPFYHDLHIHQLEALYKITENETILEYINRFKKYSNNQFDKSYAFILKAIQKILE